MRPRERRLPRFSRAMVCKEGVGGGPREAIPGGIMGGRRARVYQVLAARARGPRVRVRVRVLTSVLSDCPLAVGSRASAQQCACSYCPSNCFQEGRPFAVITFSFLFPPPPSLRPLAGVQCALRSAKQPREMLYKFRYGSPYRCPSCLLHGIR